MGDGYTKDYIVELNVKYNQMATITKSRAEHFAYFLTSWRRRIRVSELMRAQGFELSTLNREGISDRQLAGMVGNAMTLTVVQQIFKANLNGILS